MRYRWNLAKWLQLAGPKICFEELSNWLQTYRCHPALGDPRGKRFVAELLADLVMIGFSVLRLGLTHCCSRYKVRLGVLPRCICSLLVGKISDPPRTIPHNIARPMVDLRDCWSPVNSVFLFVSLNKVQVGGAKIVSCEATYDCWKYVPPMLFHSLFTTVLSVKLAEFFRYLICSLSVGSAQKNLQKTML